MLTIQDARGATSAHRRQRSGTRGSPRQPLARPRRLDIRAADLRALTAPLAVQDDRRQAPLRQPAGPAGGAAQRRRARQSWRDGCSLPRTRKAGGAIDLRMTAVPADIVGVRSVTRRAAAFGGRSMSSSRSIAATTGRSPVSGACWLRCRPMRAASWSRMPRRRPGWSMHCKSWRSAAASCCAASRGIAAFRPPPMPAFAPPASAT